MTRKSVLIGVGIWVAAVICASYIRLYPLLGHIWSPTNEQATLMVIYKIKQSFLDQILANSPQMPLAQAEQMASQRLNDTLRSDNERVRQAIEKVNQAMAKQTKSREPVYLLESDPFYFYSLTENILTRGRMADVIKGHQYFNPLMGAPFGYWQPLTLHPYVGFLLYKLIHLFNPHISLMEAVAFTPLVLTAAGIAAFMWCCRLLGAGYPAILTGCFYLAMAPVFLKRSALGWYDTDPYHLLFLFIFLGIFFKAIDGKGRTAWLSGLWLSLVLIAYSLIWQGWVFLFFMAILGAAVIAGYDAVVQKNMSGARPSLILVLVFLATLAAGGTLIYGWGHFLTFFTEGGGELQKFTVKGLNLWPNLFLEVGELKKSGWRDILSNTGGPIVLLGAGTGLARGWWVKKERRPVLKYALLAMFLLITLAMTTKAERFVVLTLVPLSLLFVLGVEGIMNNLRPRPYGKIAAVLLAVGLSFWALTQGQKNIRTVLTPIFNSAWEDALLAVRAQTPPDSIVNTWWPPGHFIKAIAHRRVPFDGASLSEGQTGYWMANVFLSTDEAQAKGLLLMLNSSGNQAADFLIGRGLKTSKAVALLTAIAGQPEARALDILKPYLKGEDSAHLLELTRGGDPHSYVLVYNELVDQSLGLVFTGVRDFAKIEQINADPARLFALPPSSSPAFIDFLWGLSSGGVPKYSEPLPLIGQNEQALTFQGGVQVRKDMNAVKISSGQYGQGVPASLIFRNQDRIAENTFADANLNYSVVVYEQDHQLVARLMDTPLARSLLMKLYYFDGIGLRNFKLIKSANDLTGRTRIKVFAVH